jgi:hypothetical protein
MMPSLCSAFFFALAEMKGGAPVPALRERVRTLVFSPEHG